MGASVKCRLFDCHLVQFIKVKQGLLIQQGKDLRAVKGGTPGFEWFQLGLVEREILCVITEVDLHHHLPGTGQLRGDGGRVLAQGPGGIAIECLEV